jgi:hypothetical protein
MRKVKHTLGDGTVEWNYEETFDGCTYGFNCDKWTKKQAEADFKKQTTEHILIERLIGKEF